MALELLKLLAVVVELPLQAQQEFLRKTFVAVRLLSMAELVRRQLKLISHPSRYCSRAADAFRKEVLPVFASPDSPLRRPLLQNQPPGSEPGGDDQN